MNIFVTRYLTSTLWSLKPKWVFGFHNDSPSLLPVPMLLLIFGGLRALGLPNGLMPAGLPL